MVETFCLKGKVEKICFYFSSARLLDLTIERKKENMFYKVLENMKLYYI